MSTRQLITMLAVVIGLNGLVSFAEEPKPIVAIDPAQAGEDFKFQGEYSGEIRSEDGLEKVGVQVIALGQGKFRAVGYPGGLPGDGWNREKKVQGEAQRLGDEVRFEAEGMVGVLGNDGTLSIQTEGGDVLGTLKKLIRKSKTLGQKPPAGAVVLFDGSSAEHFQGGRLTEDKLLQEGMTSKQTFQGFTLHLEFLLSFMPEARGQARANSGVYAQGRYEVQILDSFGLDGKDNECGGIYTVKAPDLNLCFPPLSWQTYDIDFTPAKFNDQGEKIANARLSVRHNGILIQDNVEVPDSTRAAPLKEAPTPGPIYVQNHSNPLRFRNVWLVNRP